MRIDGYDGFYAEIEPSTAWSWRPWPGRMSWWWFEVSGPCIDKEDRESLVDCHWWRFDGGAWSLRRCMHKAYDAVFAAWQEWSQAEPLGETPEEGEKG